MPKRTKKTIRKMPPLARELLRVANDLDRVNRRCLALADKVADRETDSAALQRFMVVSLPKGGD